MTEIVGKTKVKESSFPRNLTIGDTKITEKSLVAKNLNDFFILIYAQTLSPSFQTVQKPFKLFHQKLIRF